MTRFALLLAALLIGAAPSVTRAQSPDSSAAALRRLTACYAEKLAPGWRDVRVEIISNKDTTWIGRSDWNVFHKAARIQYNLATLGDLPPWKVALHEVLHLVTAELYYLAAVYAPQERVYLESASEGTVENIVAWPVWKGVC